MANSIIRAALVTTQFPYNPYELSSTIVVNKGLATQRLGQGQFNGDGAEQAEGIPQAYYLENVLPISRGFTSVAYTQMVPPIPDEAGIFDVFEIRGGGSGLALLAVGFQSQFIYDADLAAWTTVELGAFAPGTVYVANVKGVSYIGVGRVGVFTYNFSTKVIEPATILGLDIGEISGWFAAGANLCAWTVDRILWSSNIDPLDFVPSLSNGAGSESVLAVSSEIVTVLTMGEDFIIYTATNAVAGRQTGNIQYPFVFAEVANSSGISTQYHVAHDCNSGIHVSWTTQGFQQVTVQEASFIWPELRDSINRGVRITLDPLTSTPIINYDKDVDVRLSYAGNSNIAISLRENTNSTLETVYTEAYTYDTSLKRWGRIVCDHIRLFQFTVQVIAGRYTYSQLESDFINYDAIDNHEPPLAYYQIESQPVPVAGTPGANFGVLGIDGKVHVMAPSQTSQFRGDNEGINTVIPRIFLGRYKVIEEEGIIVQSLRFTKLFYGEVLAHAHGIDNQYLYTATDWIRNSRQPGEWLNRISGNSVTIEFNGSFILTDLAISCISSGDATPFAALPNRSYYKFIKHAVSSTPPDLGELTGNFIINGRWSSWELNQEQGLEEDYIPGMMPIFDVTIRTVTDIYQRPKLMSADGSTEYKAMALCIICGDFGISGALEAGLSPDERHYVTVTNYFKNEELVAIADWDTRTQLATIDYAYIDIGSGYGVDDCVIIQPGRFIVAVEILDLFATQLDFQIPIVNYTNSLDGVVSFVTVNVTDFGFDNTAFWLPLTFTPISVNTTTQETIAVLTLVVPAGDNYLRYHVSLNIDTTTCTVVSYQTVLDDTHHITPLWGQSTISEDCFELRSSNYYYKSAEISYKSAHLTYLIYGVNTGISNYTTREVDANKETVYVDQDAEPTYYDLTTELGNKLISLGFNPIELGTAPVFGSVSGYVK